MDQMLLALRVAPQHLRLQGSLSSWQPTADDLCSTERQATAGAYSLQRTCAIKPEGRRGLPVPQAGGQRKVVFAREVMCIAISCSSSWYSCTLKTMNTKAASPLLATAGSTWKRCGPPSPTMPNPSIRLALDRWQLIVWASICGGRKGTSQDRGVAMSDRNAPVSNGWSGKGSRRF